ncbi:carboxypeptidase-like regulatory domain-containing protein [Flavobacterium terrigena]|uniref:CarboxypepD_reg-like domain-containing protein n=1 Tax=Flavobacterium terrigena TaxID=402734 RepID=A0A1H6QH38_9FLAO|nr:carboxypeptidase-like regulatory domain-containing protein [Flavobacterium terrigena]SEI41206.1 CarboxypepD_reg-like domain-containing protein [Flavobacterium terrigena]
MKQKIQISIPEPCHEGWQNMTPVDKGRFCVSCQKTVLDFTYLSDNEIIKLVSKNDNLCGRINTSQLNRNLIETKRSSNYFGYFATSVLAFLGLGTSTIVAQEKPVTEQADLKYLNKATDSDKRITVTGIVTCNDGAILPGATIIIKNTSSGVQTNEKSEYSIKASLGDVLEFSYLGYETMEVEVGSNKVDVQMNSSNSGTIGVMIIIKKRTFFGRTFNKIGNWFR